VIIMDMDINAVRKDGRLIAEDVLSIVKDAMDPKDYEMIAGFMQRSYTIGYIVGFNAQKTLTLSIPEVLEKFNKG